MGSWPNKLTCSQLSGYIAQLVFSFAPASQRSFRSPFEPSEYFRCVEETIALSKQCS